MLRIYICNQCGAIRIISNNHNNSCVHCNISMPRAPITYEEYVNMNVTQREKFIDNYLRR